MLGLSLNEKKWVEVPFDGQKKDYIVNKYSMSQILAQSLASKEIDIDEIPHFLEPTIKHFLPDPDHLLDMHKATKGLAEHVKNKGKIGILADFDVDGATSAAIFIRFFKALGVECVVHIPDRMKEGYGPNLEALESLYEKGAGIILVLDCGTTNTLLFEQFSACPVIVIDHHVAQSVLPPVFALVNPNRLDETSPHKTLCTAGLAFLTIVSLNRELRNLGFYQGKKEPGLMDFLDLVALGTVCDMMVLTGLNRAFVAAGLKVLNKGQNLGLQVLKDFIGIKNDITAYHLGFMIGPRINAGGRIGESNLGVRLLTTGDGEDALAIGAHLDYLNGQRQALEKKMLEDAFFMAEKKEENSVLVIASHTFHQGVIGIVAGRLKERFHKPTIVISLGEDGKGKGSARSVSGLNIGALFHKAADLGVILGGGGHGAAAGCSLMEDQIQGFEAFLLSEYKGGDTAPELSYAATISIHSATQELCGEIDALAPFGMGNPTPKFRLLRCYIAWRDRVSGGHLKLSLKGDRGELLSAMAFRTEGTPLEKLFSLPFETPLEFLGTLQLDTFFPGNPKVKFIIEDARICGL